MSRTPLKASQLVCADWKDMDGLFEGLSSALAEHGLVLVQSPSIAGGDDYGFYICNRKPLKAELNQLETDNGMNDED